MPNETTMTIDERRKYLLIMRQRYVLAERAERGQLLDGNRSGGRCCWEQRRRRSPPIGSSAGFSEVFQYIALLLFQGGDDGHDAFCETTTHRALGAEAHLAPEHTMAHLSLAQVVGWFYARDVREGP